MAVECEEWALVVHVHIVHPIIFERVESLERRVQVPNLHFSQRIPHCAHFRRADGVRLDSTNIETKNI